MLSLKSLTKLPDDPSSPCFLCFMFNQDACLFFLEHVSLKYRKISQVCLHPQLHMWTFCSLPIQIPNHPVLSLSSAVWANLWRFIRAVWSDKIPNTYFVLPNLGMVGWNAQLYLAVILKDNHWHDVLRWRGIQNVISFANVYDKPGVLYDFPSTSEIADTM